MTAGQGGPFEKPAGRPGGDQGSGGGQPGWNPPPGPPSYPQAPQGYPQAPQGYPQAPSGPQGYGPAPSASWGAQAPPPLERPTTVRVGVGAFIASLILGVIGGIVTFSDLDTLIDRALAQARDSSSDVTLTHDTVRTAIIAGGVIALIIVAIQAMFIWFAWNGRNWARIVLWVIGGFGIVSGIVGLAGGTATSGFLGTLSVFQFLLVLGGVVALAMKPSNEWYRYRKWARATGQAR
jgi:hypothetical protein